MSGIHIGSIYKVGLFNVIIFALADRRTPAISLKRLLINPVSVWVLFGFNIATLVKGLERKILRRTYIKLIIDICFCCDETDLSTLSLNFLDQPVS